MQRNKETTLEKPLTENTRLDERLASMVLHSVDNFLDSKKNNPSPVLLYQWLSRGRNAYKQLNNAGQKSISILLTTLVVFGAASLLTISFSWGYRISTWWVTYFALYSLKSTISILQKISDLALTYFLVIVPQALKETASKLAIGLIFLLVALLMGWLFAPVYLIYRIFLLLGTKTSTAG